MHGHACDPKTSVLDANCKAHDVDNLCVVDRSFFPSSAVVNPALTIMANALRVGDHLLGQPSAVPADQGSSYWNIWRPGMDGHSLKMNMQTTWSTGRLSF